MFAANGSVTAGNLQLADVGRRGRGHRGERGRAKTFQSHPYRTLPAYSVAGVPPEIMGIGPIKAIPKALKQVGLKQEDLDWIELNEAFAAQSQQSSTIWGWIVTR